MQGRDRDIVIVLLIYFARQVYRNKVAEEVVAIERRPGGAQFKDIQHLVSGARGRKVYELGDPEYGIWTCGMCIGLIRDIPTCEKLLKDIEREAEDIIQGLQKKVTIRKRGAAGQSKL